MVAAMPNPPTIKHGGSQAFYRNSTDSVQMPNKADFVFKVGFGEPVASPVRYYATLFHELGHSTGHASRLAREGVTEPHVFGTPNYSKEELVAEMTAAFLCGVTGIENNVVANSAAYIQSWLQALKGDRKMVVMAAAQAQRAADYILDVKADEVKEAA